MYIAINVSRLFEEVWASSSNFLKLTCCKDGFFQGIMVLVSIIIYSEKKLPLQYAENSWKVRI